MSSLGNCKFLSSTVTTEQKSGHISVKQRSDEWLAIRSEYQVSGSILFDALGFGKLCDKKQLYNSVHKGIKKLDPNPKVAEDIEHGTDCEKHMVATLATKILPIHFTNVEYREVGCFTFSQYCSNHHHTCKSDTQ